jgi:hypothetical protein
MEKQNPGPWAGGTEARIAHWALDQSEDKSSATGNGARRRFSCCLGQEGGAGMSADRELTATRRAIALGKVTAFADEAARLSELVQRRRLDHGAAIDALWDAADANDLLGQHGIDFVQRLLADAFGQEQPAPLWMMRAA